MATLSLYTTSTFAPLLKRFIVSPSTFPLDDIKECVLHLIVAGGANEIQIAAFLTGLKMSGRDKEGDVIACCAEVMRGCSVVVDITNEDKEVVCDIVGTGGDGQNTFNVSTTSGLVAAGAGCRVYKHGNKAATSSSGSADILLSLNCPILSLPPASLPTLAATSQFLFLFAPLYHPAMSLVAPVRKALGFPTIFNLLGPLINPCRPSAMILGVSEEKLGRVFADALRLLGVKRAWVVCGEEGLDEISPEGKSHVWDLKDGAITYKSVSPADFGLASHPLSSVAGGSPEENAATLISLFDGQLSANHPVENFVVINTAALLFVSGKATDLLHGVTLARESINNGGAKEALRVFGERSRALVV